MSEMYFAPSPGSASRPEQFTLRWDGIPLTFWTDAGVFSRGEIDRGSEILLRALPGELSGRVLDLGCGWGIVGTVIGRTRENAQLVLSDVNSRAVELARRNLQENGVRGEAVLSDGFENLSGTFDYIVTNPPIRAGKKVIYRLFRDAAERLRPGGALFIVIRRQQGAESALKELKTLFETAEPVEKKGGFWVIACRGPGAGGKDD